MPKLHLPEDLTPVLDAVAEVGATYEGVFLVGGAVRDILLGERGFDVDIVVEGDAIGFARVLAAALGGHMHPHEKFGTAVVRYGDEQRIDVAAARTESYHAPAALPSVEHASLRDDLFRRDFTINAMAASLKGEELGELLDPFGGHGDLEAGRLRVLHDRSFIDDPTRILRGIRYENRYGFRMDEHTTTLARECIATGHVGDLSGARLRDDVIALFEEGDVSHSLPRLAELGADKEIHPHVVADAEAVALFDRLRELNARHELGVPTWRLGFMTLARTLPEDEIDAWLEALKIRRQDAKQIKAAVTAGPRIAGSLRADSLSPADVVALAEPYAPDAPLFALALDEVPQLHDYFERLGDIHLEINGADVAGLGLDESPRVGEILAELRRRKLNGELDGRESELAAARELIAQP